MPDELADEVEKPRVWIVASSSALTRSDHGLKLHRRLSTRPPVVAARAVALFERQNSPSRRRANPSSREVVDDEVANSSAFKNSLAQLCALLKHSED